MLMVLLLPIFSVIVSLLAHYSLQITLVRVVLIYSMLEFYFDALASFLFFYLRVGILVYVKLVEGGAVGCCYEYA